MPDLIAQDQTQDAGIVIVGGGHAGAQAAISLRQLGFEGPVTLAGMERDLPYERPPLSKGYLTGDVTFDRILIRSPEFWAERHIQLRLGVPVSAIEPSARQVVLADGARLGYGSLIWAAGGAARRLSCDGGEAAGVHTVRSRADVDQMLRELPSAERIVVVGGGYIGLESAAALRHLGKHVTVLEAAGRVLARVAGEALSNFYAAAHRARGVDLRLGACVARLEVAGGRVCRVRLADGGVLGADMVIVGIGIEPNVAPLLAAGAQAEAGGILVDEACRSSLPGIYAVGDCAAHRNTYADDRVIRLESVQNATDQATVAARAICGRVEPYAALPWFWSNQYDLKLQTVGLSGGHDRAVLRGDPGTNSFSVIYLLGPKVIALDCVNAVRDLATGRTMVSRQIAGDPAGLADAAVPLKDLFRRLGG